MDSSRFISSISNIIGGAEDDAASDVAIATRRMGGLELYAATDDVFEQEVNPRT